MILNIQMVISSYLEKPAALRCMMRTISLGRYQECHKPIHCNGTIHVLCYHSFLSFVSALAVKAELEKLLIHIKQDTSWNWYSMNSGIHFTIRQNTIQHAITDMYIQILYTNSTSPELRLKEVSAMVIWHSYLRCQHWSLLPVIPLSQDTWTHCHMYPQHLGLNWPWLWCCDQLLKLCRAMVIDNYHYILILVLFYYTQHIVVLVNNLAKSISSRWHLKCGTNIFIVME